MLDCQKDNVSYTGDVKWLARACVCFGILFFVFTSILSPSWRNTSSSELERILVTLIPLLSGVILCVTALMILRAASRNRMIDEFRRRDSLCKQVCHDLKIDISGIQRKMANPIVFLEHHEKGEIKSPEKPSKEMNDG